MQISDICSPTSLRLWDFPSSLYIRVWIHWSVKNDKVLRVNIPVGSDPCREDPTLSMSSWPPWKRDCWRVDRIRSTQEFKNRQHWQRSRPRGPLSRNIHKIKDWALSVYSDSSQRPQASPFKPQPPQKRKHDQNPDHWKWEATHRRQQWTDQEIKVIY